ncbi:MAG: hypothetical protein HP494_01785 [Nitrospira sp.]|nr:hypothetical protein [Nitrospira sp.]
MAQASGSADFWLSDERQTDLSRRLWRAVVISLVVHVGVLAVVSWIRLPKHGERPSSFAKATEGVSRLHIRSELHSIR